MKLLGEFLLDPAWHCNVVNNPIMLAPSLLQGSIGKSRKGNLAWDTNLFLGGAVLPASRQKSGGVIKLPLIILLQIKKLCSLSWRLYFFVITIHQIWATKIQFVIVYWLKWSFQKEGSWNWSDYFSSQIWKFKFWTLILTAILYYLGEKSLWKDEIPRYIGDQQWVTGFIGVPWLRSIKD
jgi:hypothetical protein